MLRKNKTSPGGDGKGSGPGSRQRLSKTGVIKVFRVQDVSSTFVNPAETDTKYMCQICRLPRDSTVIPRYNAPRYNADLAITRFFTPKVFLPHFLKKGKFSAKLVNILL